MCVYLSAVYHITSFVIPVTYTLFTLSNNYLDHNLDHNLDCNQDGVPKDVPDYMVHSLFNTTELMRLLFIVQSLHSTYYVY